MGHNNQPDFLLRYDVRVVVDTDIFKEKVSEIPKELVRAVVRAMSFGVKGVLPKVLLQSVLGGCFDIMLSASR